MKRLHHNYLLSDFSDDDWEELDNDFKEDSGDTETPKLKTKADRKRIRRKKDDD
jgi:hypothetical protein